MRLRKAVSRDIQRINQLVAEMFRAINGQENAAGYDLGALDYYFSGGEDWICVAEADGQVVGFLSMEVHREDVDYIYLDDLSVSAACRGQGIGTALLEEADKFVRRIGFSVIVLHVKISNPRAKKLYERMGYRVMDDDGDRFRMIKEL